jgi:hypothetical protein
MNGSSHDYATNKLNQIEFFFFIRPKPLGQALSQERGLRVPVAIAAQQQQLHESFRW